MCRLFGQHAHPDFDPCAPLCDRENALRFQSHKHPHGWGIAWYDAASGAPAPRVRRGLLPAHQDDAFVATAREARSSIVVAHVRDASVGPVSAENTHPFTLGRWVFAHNGTVARFRRSAKVRARIEAELEPDLRALVRGDTDSERCFLLFLSRLRARAPLDAAPLARVREALAEATRAIVGIADSPRVKPSSLNFLVTDGRLLAATRLGRTLHVAADAGPRHAFVIASEPIGPPEGWEEVPDGGFVGTEDGRTGVKGPLARPEAA
jgi:glutamine amidotransferase